MLVVPYVRKIVQANKPTLDILMCLDGYFVAIEVKRPGEKLTKLQEWNIREIAKSGGFSFSTDSLSDCQNKIYAILRIIEGK